ncbi:MAG: hypothetical protein ACO20H_07090 [Bacteriovoracaceae bacterium]
MKQTILLGLLIFSFVSCNPINTFFKEIKSYGYIPYPSPMETAGPGTIIGGSPKSMSWIAAPDSCFPDQINGVPTNIRRIDKTSIPSKERKVTTNGKFNVEMIKALNTGMPTFKIGAKFSTVETMALTFKGVHIEYLDTVYLLKFYNEKLSETCKDLLNHFAFIIQALKVDEMEFKFYDRKGADIQLSVNNIKQFLDINAGVDFIVENKVSLIIKTPKYIGYQLGRWLKDEDKPLYRASKISLNKWVFKNIAVFNKDRNSFSMFRNSEQMPEESKLQKFLSDDYDIDDFSNFIN